MIRYWPVISLITAILLVHVGYAITLSPEQPLPNPALEREAQQLFSRLRCAVCNGQSVKDSEAELAQDMRRFIRRRLSEGVSAPAIEQSLVERYGESIRLSPPLNGQLGWLWLLPLPLLALAFPAIRLAYRQRSQ